MGFCGLSRPGERAPESGGGGALPRSSARTRRLPHSCRTALSMKSRILTVGIETETDIVAARDRTRRVAALLGFGQQDQTRITTAVSEIVRNAWEYARGGRIEYWAAGGNSADVLEIVVRDS